MQHLQPHWQQRKNPLVLFGDNQREIKYFETKKREIALLDSTFIILYCTCSKQDDMSVVLFQCNNHVARVAKDFGSDFK